MSSAKLQDTGSTYKIQLYFCTLAMNNPKMKFKETIPFTIVSEMIKYLEINRSTKLILKKLQNIIQETKEDLNKWGNI